MTSRVPLYSCLAVIVLMLAGDHTVAAERPTIPEQAAQQQAARMIRGAKLIMSSQAPSLETIEMATLLAHEAVDLDARNEHAWRVLLQLAELAEDRQLQVEAVDHLAALNPADQVIRLKSLTNQIDQYQTVEERVEAYRRLLEPANRQRLGNAVASYLALDLALLERRRGNTQQFATWLAEAVSLDASNRVAAAMATGYFRMNVADAFAETELLVNLFMADPMHRTSQVALASHLLEHGAHDAASRLYTLAINTHEAARNVPSEDLLADLALAQWGGGDAEAALRTIRDRQRLADSAHRRQLLQEHPEMTTLERARETALLGPTLSVLRAAIHQGRDSERADAALHTCIRSYELAIERASQEDVVDHEAIARLKLDLAWVLLWLDGHDLQHVATLLEDATSYEALSDRAEARFAGWRALRSGDAEHAAQRLEPFLDEDPAASLGHSLAQLELGYTRDAARGLLALARSQPGTVIGVWATHKLWGLLGQQVSVKSDDARRMQKLIDAIPQIIDRFPIDPTTAVSLRISPTQPTFAPYEPVIVTLEVTNHAPFPIAIDTDGPIRPQVALTISTEMATLGRLAPLPPLVVDINQRLRLMPRERIEIPIDLRTTRLGLLLDAAPLPGAIIRVRGMLNFVVAPNNALLPGVLGTERESSRFRVDGFRLSESWLERTIAKLVEADDDLQLAELAALAQVAASPTDQQTGGGRLVTDTRSALIDVFPTLDSITQAWLLASMPPSRAFEPIFTRVRESEDHHLLMTYLLFHARDRDDPVIVRAMRGDNERVARFAEMARARLADMDDPFMAPPPQ